MKFTKQLVPHKSTALFSDLFNNYIDQDKQLSPFYNYFIDKQAYQSFINENSFSYVDRGTLNSALKSQNTLVTNTSNESKNNCDLLLNTNTFTVTTGHQLCLFTGPLYFIYKIISAINLAKTLKNNFPDKNFVPIYWMASEDHDFEEVNHVHTFGKTLTWTSTNKGSVGNFNTLEIKSVIAELKLILGDTENANELILLFENAYLNHTNLANATRYLCNELFGSYGLVILDGNDVQLKALFKNEFKKDIFENTAHTAVNTTINELKKTHPIQVTPRLINVFYTDNNLRERIEKEGDGYKVVNTTIVFSQNELETLIETTPEKLSPNVVLRPLYQQKILPNIAYVGGPGELAYWLEFKNLFNVFNITLPILMPRNFVLLIDKGTQTKFQKLNLTTTDAFTDGEILIKQLIKTQHNDVNLDTEKQKIVDLFLSVSQTVSLVDKSLIGATEAEKQKAINGLIAIEQKINKALKQKSETDINQIWSIKSKLFPNNIPQERYDNFTMYYAKYGKDFIPSLINELTYDLQKTEYTVLLEN